eukprot:10151745-Lingulodinium_polyedra.AAC.1
MEQRPRGHRGQPDALARWPAAHLLGQAGPCLPGLCQVVAPPLWGGGRALALPGPRAPEGVAEEAGRGYPGL